MEALRQQIAKMRQSFFDEEILDKYFLQLEQLEDISNPGFVKDVVTLYLRDSTKTLATIEDEIVGANKVLNEVNKAREHCKEGNLEA
ncbi:pseudo histidine-containing phosphotransfer protein 5-like [Citrus sinensis]|uniref:pseudo histidine-containing phosphotransfer protein 5-like n=1 Tax=Citrus sinensis TaxID=2711 RepID=UPI002279C6AC|nr:pseudo histidine-containing phosphotransfer protein 5-like [Citrus sinensis]